MQPTQVTQEVQQPVTPKVEAKEEIHEPAPPSAGEQQEHDTHDGMDQDEEEDLSHLDPLDRDRVMLERFLENMPTRDQPHELGRTVSGKQYLCEPPLRVEPNETRVYDLKVYVRNNIYYSCIPGHNDFFVIDPRAVREVGIPLIQGLPEDAQLPTPRPMPLIQGSMTHVTMDVRHDLAAMVNPALQEGDEEEVTQGPQAPLTTTPGDDDVPQDATDVPVSEHSGSDDLTRTD